MSSTRVLRPRSVLAALLAATFATPALGQVPISGTIHDGAGGPLLAGTVYHATSDLLVPTGTTLTIQAGAIVKFQLNVLHVEGTLLAVGASASRIRFTSIHDDSAGGDTNGNGPSSGGPDQWRGIVFGADADASVLEYVDVAYSGWGFIPAVRSDGADLTLRNVRLRDGQHGLLQLTNGARPIVEGCDFQRSGSQPAVFGATFDALPGFAANTASGAGAGNFIRVDHNAPSGSVSIGRDDCLNGWLVLPNGLNLPAGLTLSLGAGIVVKPGNLTGIHVDGTLITSGTQEDPVVFTSLSDDLYGGDTNNDGPSIGGPDQWQGLRFTATAGGSSLANTVVRCTGWGFHAAIEIFGSSPTFSDCLLRDGQHGAIDFNGTVATPTFTRCAFQNNFNYAVQIPLAAAAGFIDCIALGSTYGQFLRIVDGTVATPLVLGPENMVNGAFVLANQLVVPQGSSLTLRRGVVFKSENGVGATIHGAIDVQADGSSPVVFTRIEDDAFGGDTNSNGPSSANTDSWTGVHASVTATGILKGVRVRYSGWGFTAGIQADSPALIVRDARVDRCAHDARRGTGWPTLATTAALRSSAAPSRCAMRRCSAPPVRASSAMARTPARSATRSRTAIPAPISSGSIPRRSATRSSRRSPGRTGTSVAIRSSSRPRLAICGSRRDRPASTVEIRWAAPSVRPAPTPAEPPASPTAISTGRGASTPAPTSSRTSTSRSAAARRRAAR
jgi:hypothetical protein